MRTIREWGLVVLWMGAIFYGSSRPSLPGSLGRQDAIGDLFRAAVHLAEYAILAALTYRAAIAPAVRGDASLALGNPRAVQVLDVRLVVAVLALSVGYALSDELHQSFVPGRCFSLADLGVDAAGVALGLGAVARWRMWSGRSLRHRKGGPHFRR